MGLQRFTSVESALAMLFGKGVKIAKRDRVSGGDINEAFGLTLTDGRRIFMKANRKENVSFFYGGIGRIGCDCGCRSDWNACCFWFWNG